MNVLSKVSAAECKTPGKKIRSKGKGRGMAVGKGEGPVGRMKGALGAAWRKQAEEQIPGGKAEGKLDSKYPPSELRAGIDIEKEHTPDPSKAKEIAKDHLEEHSNYYSALHEMEEGLEEAKEEGKKPDTGAMSMAAKEEAEEAAGKPVTLKEVKDYFKEEQDPEDYEFHQWAESKGVSPHAAEELAYQLAAQAVTGKKPEETVEGGPEETEKEGQYKMAYWFGYYRTLTRLV
jgi:hypothetical protein